MNAKIVSEKERNEMKKYLMIVNNLCEETNIFEEKKKNLLENREKKNNIVNKKTIKKLKNKKISEQFSVPNKPVFGKNLKYIEKEKNDLEKAVEDYENYIIWNGLRFRERAIDEISKKYGFDREGFKRYLIKKNIYSTEIPYWERKK